MRALLLIGVILGAAYANVIWLLVEIVRPSSPGILLILPAILGGFALIFLFAWTLRDAFVGGSR